MTTLTSGLIPLLLIGNSAEHWRTALANPKTTAPDYHFIPRKLTPPSIRPFERFYMDPDEKKHMHACRPF